MFEIAKEARIRPDDFSKLAKVSRVTASMWFNGHTKPHHLLQVRVNELLDAIKAAMDAGDLPVPHDVGRRERHLYVTKAVEKHMKRQVEATANI
jgi:hypothetical protein